MIARLRRWAEITRRQRRPVRFLLSRLLMRTGLSRLLRIRLDEDVVLRFHPSALSAQLWIDPRDRHEDADLLRAWLRAGETAIDVGANVGSLALVAASAVGPTGRVVALEPHPRIHRYLLDNVALNGAAQVEVLPFAAGDREGLLHLADSNADDENALVAEGGLEVRAARLDDLELPAGEVSLLKVDVEGFEAGVFRGAPELLARTRCVLFECWDAHLARSGETMASLLAPLEAAGLVPLRFRPDGRRLERVGSEAACPACVNLLAVRDFSELEERTGLTT